MQCIVKGEIYFTFYYTLHKKGDDIMGKSYNAEDYFDRSTVRAACKEIDNEAKQYSYMSAEIKKAATNFEYDSLEVEGQTMYQPVCDVADFVGTVEDSINSYTSNVLTSLDNAILELQGQLDAQNPDKQQSS